jgi:hypothetical protein
MKKVFLGGTCNGSLWRDKLIKLLKINYFNPVVKNWTKAAMDEEIKQRKKCDFCLYILTPKITGFYAIAELVDDSNKRPGKTVFCFLKRDGKKSFSQFQVKSMQQVGELVKRNGAKYFKTLKEVANYLNNQ